MSDAFLSVLFADDSNLFISGHDIETLCNKINEDLEKIQEWLCANKLSLNIMKTHYMVFTSRNKCVSDIDIKINNVSIERVYVTKFLGILIDSQLNWKHHIEYTCKKLSKCIGILSKAKKKLHKPSLITLYYSFAYPYMIYCNQVWGNGYPTIINKLVLIQKKTCKANYMFPLQSPLWTIDVYQQNFITNWYQYISYWNIYVSMHTQRRSWIVLKFLQYK